MFFNFNISHVSNKTCHCNWRWPHGFWNCSGNNSILYLSSINSLLHFSSNSSILYFRSNNSILYFNLSLGQNQVKKLIKWEIFKFQCLIGSLAEALVILKEDFYDFPKSLQANARAVSQLLNYSLSTYHFNTMLSLLMTRLLSKL